MIGLQVAQALSLWIDPHEVNRVPVTSLQLSVAASPPCRNVGLVGNRVAHPYTDLVATCAVRRSPAATRKYLPTGLGRVEPGYHHRSRDQPIHAVHGSPRIERL
jgi:hypothetical protein